MKSLYPTKKINSIFSLKKFAESKSVVIFASVKQEGYENCYIKHREKNNTN